MNGLLHRTRITLEMVKFSHSVFALPFALASLLLASGGRPDPWVVSWVVVAMVSARSAAMAFNRLVDLAYDAANPRTASRALPAGSLSTGFVRLFVVLSCAVFVAAAGFLNPLCLALAPVALLVVLGYSYAKRFTVLCHLWLGASLGISPLAAWIAVTGAVDRSIVVPSSMAVAVLFWVAGFDLIYACQDVHFDRAMGLHSLPARLGVRRALRLAAAFHGVTVLALLFLAWVAPLGPVFLAGTALVAVLLLVEHLLAHRKELEAAFFRVNSIVGLVVLAAVLGDLAWAP